MCIDKYFTLKLSSIGDLNIYLGDKLRKMMLPNVIWCWSMIPSKYVQLGVKNWNIHLKENYDRKYALLKEPANPFACRYDPKVDVSEPLDADMASYYQYITGIRQWMIKLGHIDIATKVSMLSSLNYYLS